MDPFDFQFHTRSIFGCGAIKRLGTIANELDLHRPLVVSDRGLLKTEHVEFTLSLLERSGLKPVGFHEFDTNPDVKMIESGRAFAEPLGIDSLIGLGGGSSMDCAKGINFVLTNGGTIDDYHGYGKATQPMLPMIGIPTTAGTGSEAQHYALVSDPKSHMKMACGDPKAAFRVAILDPNLTISQPATVTAIAGFDALAHAVETYVTTKRTAISVCFAREAWKLLSTNYERVLTQPESVDARGAMQLGAHYAGIAIEQSMLGAAHACANPLTARYGVTHGIALAILLPHVVRWNASVASNLYDELLSLVSDQSTNRDSGEKLSALLETYAKIGSLPNRLATIGVKDADLPQLAEEAAQQWTAAFNPRPFNTEAALEVYKCAY